MIAEASYHCAVCGFTLNRISQFSITVPDDKGPVLPIDLNARELHRCHSNEIKPFTSSTCAFLTGDLKVQS